MLLSAWRRITPQVDLGKQVLKTRNTGPNPSYQMCDLELEFSELLFFFHLYRSSANILLGGQKEDWLAGCAMWLAWRLAPCAVIAGRRTLAVCLRPQASTKDVPTRDD